jgi:hypothetical protein
VANAAAAAACPDGNEVVTGVRPGRRSGGTSPAADLEDHGQAGAVRRGGQRGHLPGTAQAHRGAGDLAAAVNANPAWRTVALVAELASFPCNFGLQRLALRTKDWVPVVTAGLAGNAVTSSLPGGGAAGAAAQFRMLPLRG